MRPFHRKLGIGATLVALVTGLVWNFSPVQPVATVATLSDPAKLATLGERGADARLNKIVYWLDQARRRGLPPAQTIRVSQLLNGTREPRASLVRESLLRNLKIADGLGLLTAENRERLRRGRSATITRGPYAGKPAEIDHIVPYSLAKEAGNELANLEMLPEPLNRRKSNRMGDRQLAHARRLYDAGLISIDSLQRVESHGR
jgi:hypothetical protein